MSFTDEEVNACLRSMQTGDEQAAGELWKYCFPKLLDYSRKKLPDRLRRALDEEDVALSAFKSFCLGFADGSLGEIRGRDELWRLLYCITARKANGQIRHEMRQKRGGGQVSGESIFLTTDDQVAQGGIENVADASLSPGAKAEFANECQQFLERLGDDTLQTIALLRIEGYSVDEIAARVGCAKRSVERRLSLIRSIWTELAAEGKT